MTRTQTASEQITEEVTAWEGVTAFGDGERAHDLQVAQPDDEHAILAVGGHERERRAPRGGGPRRPGQREDGRRGSGCGQELSAVHAPTTPRATG